MAFYQLSVFSLPENIARRQLSAGVGCKVQLRSFLEPILDRGVAVTVVQLVSIHAFFFVQTSARRKTVLECFSIVQLSASASKSFPVLQEL